MLPLPDDRGPLVFGYARVSTDDQVLHLQTDALAAAGIPAARIFRDQASGKIPPARRAGYAAMWRELRAGDTVTVWRLDRLTRTLLELLELLVEFDRAGLIFRSLGEHLETATPAGRLNIQMIGAMAQFERDRLRERTLGGIQSARARGVHCGRPAALTPDQILLARQLGSEKSPAEIARALRVATGTIRRVLNAQGPYAAELSAAAGAPIFAADTHDQHIDRRAVELGAPTCSARISPA